MHAELPVLSFSCAVLLAPLLPWKHLRTRIAIFSVVFWLLVCNIIHGVNTILWAGNVDIRFIVWCDITTNILRGATVALLTACICISYNLEAVSSTRKISKGPLGEKKQMILELVLCLLIPALYISLHSFTQDHRFDLVQNFGCSSSVLPSIPSLVFVWLPPLILCIISFVYSGLAVYHVYKQKFEQSISSYIEYRSTLTSSTFFYRLAISLTISVFLFVLVLVSIISPWVYSRTVPTEQLQFSDILVIHSPDYLRVMLLAWWIVPFLSVIHFVLSMAFGEDAKGIRTWFQTHLGHTWLRLDSSSLPTHRQKFPEFIATAPPLTTKVDLKSGWDDMLDSKNPKGFLPRIKTKYPSSYTLSTSSRTHSMLFHTPSTSPEPSSGHGQGPPGNDIFMASTLSYLGSPVAQTLGLTSPSSPVPKDTPLGLSPADVPKIIQSIPEDAVSIVSSVWDKPWPQPPSTVPSPSPTPTPPRPGGSSRSSVRSASSEPLYLAATPSHPRVAPFEGSDVLARPDSPVIPKPAMSKKPSVKDLRRARNRGSLNGYAPGDVIYMTVVRETVTV